VLSREKDATAVLSIADSEYSAHYWFHEELPADLPEYPSHILSSQKQDWSELDPQLEQGYRTLKLPLIEDRSWAEKVDTVDRPECAQQGSNICDDQQDVCDACNGACALAATANMVAATVAQEYSVEPELDFVEPLHAEAHDAGMGDERSHLASQLRDHFSEHQELAAREPDVRLDARGDEGVPRVRGLVDPSS